MQVLKHWNRQPRGAVEPPSLKVALTQNEWSLSNLLWAGVALASRAAIQPQRHHSFTLQFHHRALPSNY